MMKYSEIYYMEFALFESPIGTFKLSAENGEIVNIKLPGWAGEIKSDKNAVNPSVKNGMLKVCSFLENYFAGKKQPWKGKQTPKGTDFYTKVWQETTSVPFGTTINYNALGQKAGRQNAARAVGSAMARNPLPILVPCHRVITSDLKLGGYGGGLDMKHWLLKHEGIILG